MDQSTPDRPVPPQEPDQHSGRFSSDAALRLAQAISRAQAVIAWEKIWPILVRVLGVIGVFLIVSWLGFWMVLPVWAKALGLLVLLAAALFAIAPLVRFRWPSREDALRRLDHKTGIAHRPATALTDTLTSNDPLARALWQTEKERVLRSLTRLRAGPPSPDLPRHDPLALRALVMVALVATFFAASGERIPRILAAFDFHHGASAAPVRFDAWVTPPTYTGKPPIVLSSAARDATDEAQALSVPSGSVIVARTSHGTLDLKTNGGLVAAEAPDKTTASDEQEHRFVVSGDGEMDAATPSGRHIWRFTAIPDQPPKIALEKDPERRARGSIELTYSLEDDYGVTEAHARFALPPPDAKAANKTDDTDDATPRPLYDPPGFALSLPGGRTKNGVGQTAKDLSDNPYAGAEVILTLTARDEAGNEGTSAPLRFQLPQRLFTKPLARVLIEQRRILALDAQQHEAVGLALEALMIAPEIFTPDAGHYLGLRNVASQLAGARTDDGLREVVTSLWALALSIEDAGTSDAEKELRAAQEALREALERGATDDEIKQLTDRLRTALNNYMRQLAEQMRNNPQQLSRPLDSNTRVMRQQDLDNMISRMEQLSRSGDKDAAKQLLEQMQQMLENLQMAQPALGDPTGEMEQALNELGDMIRKQQQLRDRTFREGQDARRDRYNGEPRDQGAMQGLQQDQQTLRDRLRQLQQEMARRGLNPQQGQQGQQGQEGQQGQQGQQGGNGDPLGEADSEMGDAGSQLGEGNAGSAADAQGRALDALRRGAQDLAEAMQQQMGEGQGQGNRVGRQQRGGQRTDPMGRSLRGRELGDDQSVKIPGEIDVQRARRILEELRRRLSEPGRPQIELDYIERLLKGY